MNRNRLIFGTILLCVGALIALSINRAQSQSDLVAKGKYLVDTVGACGHCHTPRAGAEFDMEMYLAGHPANASAPRYDFSMMRQGIFLLTATTMSAFSGPFGTSFASNLTPDNETGLGEWTEAMFIGAMRTGHHQGEASNRKILPPMPTKHYAQMSDDDLRAIWAYLRTVKPVKNEVSPALNQRGRPY